MHVGLKGFTYIVYNLLCQKNLSKLKIIEKYVLKTIINLKKYLLNIKT